MPKMVQIRNVPDDLHRAIKQRALDEGTSMSDLLLRWAAREVARPTGRDLAERLRRRSEHARGAEVDWAAVVREGRDERWS